MSKYVVPKTRIVRIKDYRGERFYPQYRGEIIPYLWYEWDTLPTWHKRGEEFTLETAKETIDDFLVRHKQYWEERQEVKRRKKLKKEKEYIKYP